MEAENREAGSTSNMPTTTTTTQTQTQESQTYRDRNILEMMQGYTYRTPRTKRKREETEIGNVQAPKRQLKLTGLIDIPTEVSNEGKERKKDKQQKGNKQHINISSVTDRQ